jgi:MFS family permease
VTTAPPAERSRAPLALWFTLAAFTAGVQAIVALFPQYEQDLGLSTQDLTIVYGCYPIALIPAVLLQGPLSDALGRKRVALLGLGVQLLACVLGILAQDLAWLVASRVLQGWSMGALWATCTAWVRDFTPEERRDDVARWVSALTMGSNAVGAVVFGILASTTHSTAVPWAVNTAVLALAAVSILGVPETVTRRSWPGLSIRLRRPPGHEREFTGYLVPLVLATMTMGTIAIVMAPSLVEEIRGPSAVWSGAALALFLGGGAAVQVRVTAWATARQALLLSALLLPLGYLGILAGLAAHSLPIGLLGMGCTGAGVALGFCGLLISAERMSGPLNRASVLAAFSVVLYIAQTAPALGAGSAEDALGLTPLLALVGGIGTAALCGFHAWGPRPTVAVTDG